MSLALKAMMAAVGQEHARLRAAAMQVVSLTPISQIGLLEVQSANASCLVDCVNRIFDPEGLGGLHNWSAVNGTLARAPGSPPAAWATLTPGYVELVATVGGSVSVSTAGPDGDTFPAGTPFWAYLLAAGPASVLTVRGLLSDAVYATQPLGASAGWTLVRLTGVCETAEGLTVRLAGSTGGTYGLTGVTLVTEKDPGGPFSGDYQPQAAEQAYAYRWQGGALSSPSGARNHSRSLRYGTTYDLVAIAEQQSGIDLAPLGLTVAQRALYLQQRFKSRHIPWSSTFIDLLAELIQTEDPSFRSSQIVVEVNAADRSFTVSFNYNPNGALYQRILQQIRATAPCHLAFQSISTSVFRADISHAGDPL